MKGPQRYTLTQTYYINGELREYSFHGTLAHLKHLYMYKLEIGKSKEKLKGNKEINVNPKSIQSLCKNLELAIYNIDRNKNKYRFEWELIEEIPEDQ